MFKRVDFISEQLENVNSKMDGYTRSRKDFDKSKLNYDACVR